MKKIGILLCLLLAASLVNAVSYNEYVDALRWAYSDYVEHQNNAAVNAAEMNVLLWFLVTLTPGQGELDMYVSVPNSNQLILDIYDKIIEARDEAIDDQATDVHCQNKGQGCGQGRICNGNLSCVKICKEPRDIENSPLVKGKVKFYNDNGNGPFFTYDYCQDGSVMNVKCCLDCLNNTNYTAADCPSDYPYCTDGRCVECTSDSECANGRCRNNKCVGQPSRLCFDTDGGRDYGNKGIVHLNVSNRITKYRDNCTSDSILREYYCDSNDVAYEDHTCNQECKNGKCLGEPQQDQACIDSDGGANIYVKGKMTDNNVEKIDNCLDSSNLNEYFCNNGQGDLKTYTCERGCQEGACNPSASTCVDSDNGIFEKIAGHVTFNNKVFKDACTLFKGKVKEKYCQNEVMKTINKPCENGCKYNANNEAYCQSGDCTPDCTNKQCGNDGCGGSCGACSADKQCNRQGRCVTGACTNCGGDGYCGPDETLANSVDCWCLPDADVGRMGVGQLCGFGQTITGCPGTCDKPLDKFNTVIAKCGDGTCSAGHGETYDNCKADCSEICSPDKKTTVWCDDLLNQLASGKFEWINGPVQAYEGLLDTSVFPYEFSGAHSENSHFWRTARYIPFLINPISPAFAWEQSRIPQTVVTSKDGSYYFAFGPSYNPNKFQLGPGAKIPSSCIEEVRNDNLYVKLHDANPLKEDVKVTLTNKQICDIAASASRTWYELNIAPSLRKCEKIVNLLDHSTMITGTPQSCGDLWCNANKGENENNCVADCEPLDSDPLGLETECDNKNANKDLCVPKCGNGNCEFSLGESSKNCPNDCKVCNNNGRCDFGRELKIHSTKVFGFSEGADCKDCIETQTGDNFEGRRHNDLMREWVGWCSNLKGERFAKYARIGTLVNEAGAMDKLLFP